jgi:hypothetical protein
MAIKVQPYTGVHYALLRQGEAEGLKTQHRTGLERGENVRGSGRLPSAHQPGAKRSPRREGELSFPRN